MTLKEYLEKNKISIENAAKDLGFSYEDISCRRSSRTQTIWPRRRLMPATV